MAKYYEIKFVATPRFVQTQNPGSAFQTSDVNKIVGLSSGYISLLSTDSTTIGLFTYEQFGILRGIPGTCTAKSTQACAFVPIAVGDVLSAAISSDRSTSGTPVASSDIGKQVGLKVSGPDMDTLSTAGTLLTQGPIRATIVGVPSTAYADFQIIGLNLVKMTTA